MCKKEGDELFGMLGEYTHTIDAKGRMNFPAKLRDELGEKFIISKQIGAKCLCVYSDKEWQKLTDAIAAKPSSQTMDIKRFLFGGACEVLPDKQGRIQLPAPLREYAGLTGEVIVVGLSGTAEIWDKAAWEGISCEITMDKLQADMLKLEL